MSWLALGVLVLLLCAVGCSTQPPQAASEGDGGARPMDGAADADSDAASGGGGCSAGVALQIEQDGERLSSAGEEVSAAYTVLGGREVFRLRFATRHDPSADADDDEFTLVTAIDLVPSQLLRQRGTPLAIEQQIETAALSAGESGYEDDARVAVSAAAAHAQLIRRVLVERHAPFASGAAARYQVSGQLSIRMTSARRVLGSLSLRLRGAIPLGFEQQTELSIAGCFDVDAARPLACVPGLACATECTDVEQWVCGDCGTLVFTHDCGCRPELSPLPSCQGDGPAGAGELCGAQWWCDRPCAEGLACAPDPGYGDPVESDAGAGAACHYSTCRVP